jgi:Zinc-ribbon containing domain
MNSNNFNPVQLSGLLSGGLRQLVWLGLILFLLGSVGLGWLVKSLFLLLALFFVVPIVAVFGLQWWVKKNLVQGECPVCQSPVTGINGSAQQCTNCGEALQVSAGQFTRAAQAGTIDIQAVEVQVVED